MKILRYLALDVLVHMVAVSFVLLVIIISGRFVKYLAEAAVGDLAAGILVPVLLYRLPGFMELIIPLGLFIGILMSYGRLYVESEMVIFTATGISPQRLAGYTLVPALLVMVIVGGSGNNWGSILGGFFVWFVWIEAEPVGLWAMDVLTSVLGDESALRDHLLAGAAYMRVCVMGIILLLVLRFSPRGLIPDTVRR